MCAYGDTKKQMKMVVVKIMVRTRCSTVLNKVLYVKSNGAFFSLKIVEDSHRSLGINFLTGWQKQSISPESVTSSNELRGVDHEEDEMGGDLNDRQF